jgi:hypothetical protein
MRNPEMRYDPQTLMNKAVDFLKLSGSMGVSNFTLVGPVNVPTYFSDYILLKRPDINLNKSDIFAVGKSNLNAMDFYNKALELNISQRIKDFNMPEDTSIRNAAETICALNDLPFGVLAFGESRDTKEKVVLLGFVAGIAPENALQEFKQRILERKAAFN